MRFPDGYQHVWNALACLPCLLVVFTVGDMAIQAYPAVTKNIHPWIGTIWIKHNTRQKWCGETIVWIHVVVLQSKVDQKSGVNFAGLTKKASYGFLNFSLANPHVQCVISSQRDLESPGVADVSFDVELREMLHEEPRLQSFRRLTPNREIGGVEPTQHSWHHTNRWFHREHDQCYGTCLARIQMMTYHSAAFQDVSSCPRRSNYLHPFFTKDLSKSIPSDVWKCHLCGPKFALNSTSQ